MFQITRVPLPSSRGLSSEAAGLTRSMPLAVLMACV